MLGHARGEEWPLQDIWTSLLYSDWNSDTWRALPHDFSPGPRLGSRTGAGGTAAPRTPFTRPFGLVCVGAILDRRTIGVAEKRAVLRLQRREEDHLT